MVKFLLPVFIAVLTPAALGNADDGLVDFKTQVAPIVVEHCVACHGPKKAFANYRVDSYARMMADSDAGKNIEPGKPDDSLFLELIVQAEPTGRMPKNSDPLSEREITTLRRWIEQGAKGQGIEPTADLAGMVARSNRPAAPVIYRTPVPIATIAFNQSGEELAVGGYHEVTVWDPSSGKLLRRLAGMAQRTQALAYSPKADLLAVAGGKPGESGELALIVPDGQTPPRILATASDLLLGVAFSPDGSMLATAGADRTVRTYDLASGKELLQLKQFADWVTGIAFDREGVSIAASSSDKLVKVFEVRTGKLQTTYILHNEPVLTVGFDCESNKVVSAGVDRKLHVWDPKVIAAEDGTAALLEDRFKKELSSKTIEGFGDEILDVVLSRGFVFSASADGKVRQHDLKTSNLLKTFGESGDWAYSVAIDSESKRLAVGGFDGSVRVYDIETGREIVHFLAAPGLDRP